MSSPSNEEMRILKRRLTLSLCLNLGLLLILVSQAQGASSSEIFFQSLQSTHLKVFTQRDSQRYFSPLREWDQWGLAWRGWDSSLEGAGDEGLKNGCGKEKFLQELRGHISNPELVLTSLWGRCETQWRESSDNPLTHALATLRTAFEPSLNPAARVIEWTLKGGARIKGYLFLKGPVSRPLVILRTGVFSHLRSAIAERFIMMQIFEEGPFHLLVLPSTTGEDFARDNGRFLWGGFDEGLQTSEIIDFLTNPKEPLGQLISKIHLVGISLGAHGQWLTQALETLKTTSKVDRALYFCPMVDLKKTTTMKSKKSLSEKWLMGRWIEKRLSQIQALLPPKIHPQSEQVSSSLTQSASPLALIQETPLTYQKQSLWLPDLALERRPPDPTQNLTSKEEVFWALNDFWPWLPPLPWDKTFVIWNSLDPIVPPAQNTQALMVRFPAQKDHFLQLPRGFHCSLPSAYQWPHLSLTLRGFLEPAITAATDWEGTTTLGPFASIASIDLKKVELLRDGNPVLAPTNNHSKRRFQLTLQIHFRWALRPPLLQKIEVPSALSDLNWYLNDWDEELEKSITRELRSRLLWKEEHQELTLGFRPMNSFRPRNGQPF